MLQCKPRKMTWLIFLTFYPITPSNRNPWYLRSSSDWSFHISVDSSPSYSTWDPALWMHLGKPWKMAWEFGLWHSHGRLGWSSRVLGSGWSSSSCCGYLRDCAFQISNKIHLKNQNKGHDPVINLDFHIVSWSKPLESISRCSCTSAEITYCSGLNSNTCLRAGSIGQLHIAFFLLKYPYILHIVFKLTMINISFYLIYVCVSCHLSWDGTKELHVKKFFKVSFGYCLFKQKVFNKSFLQCSSVPMNEHFMQPSHKLETQWRELNLCLFLAFARKIWVAKVFGAINSHLMSAGCQSLQKGSVLSLSQSWGPCCPRFKDKNHRAQVPSIVHLQSSPPQVGFILAEKHNLE